MLFGACMSSAKVNMLTLVFMAGRQQEDKPLRPYVGMGQLLANAAIISRLLWCSLVVSRVAHEESAHSLPCTMCPGAVCFQSVSVLLSQNHHHHSCRVGLRSPRHHMGTGMVVIMYCTRKLATSFLLPLNISSDLSFTFHLLNSKFSPL